MLPEESHKGKDDSTKVQATALSTCALLQEISFLAELLPKANALCPLYVLQGFSNKRNLVPAKTPSAKERPEQVEFTHCSPGIVA